MWYKKNGKICLDISKVNQNEFNINEENGLIFIRPKRNKWNWLDEEKKLRSIIIDLEGYVKSSGFFKFGNYGEFLNETKILDNALKDNGTVRFSRKEDGSLCVRSVIDRKIILRTRGTAQGQYARNEFGPTFYEQFLDVVREKYPKLLIPNFYPEYSLLFEYVSPKNRIILSYDYTDLIFVGGIKHSDLTLITWDEMLDITNEGNLNIVKLHTLPTNPKDLIEVIYKEWIGQEGIVARCNNDQTLVKIKSEDYLAKHRTQATMNYISASIIIRNEKITTSEEMEQYCQDNDFDWELGQAMLKYLEDYKKAVATANALIDKAKNIIKEFENKLLKEYGNKESIPDGKIWKKKFAMFIKEEQKHIRSVCFSLVGGSDGKLESFINKVVENKGVGCET